MHRPIPLRLDKATLLQRLAARQPVTALGVRSARTPEIARIAAASGHQVLWVDLEHSAMPLEAAAQICHCALDLGLLPLVRVTEREYGAIGRLLDCGAMGLIFPRIETAAQAAELVAACRFPPLGQRSAIALLPQFGLQRLKPAQLYAAANAQVLVKVLIESPLGLRNLAEIAAVPGVDLLAIGANDLSAELGAPGDYRHPAFLAALDGALATAQAAGKPLVIGGVGDAALLAEYLQRGAAPFLMTGTDTDLLLGAAQARVQQALAALPPAFQTV